MPSENSKPPPAASPDPGLRFNNVGREEPANEILKAQLDPAVRRRTVAFGSLVLVVLAVLIYVIFLRSGGTVEPEREAPFRPPPPSVK